MKFAILSQYTFMINSLITILQYSLLSDHASLIKYSEASNCKKLVKSYEKR